MVPHIKKLFRLTFIGYMSRIVIADLYYPDHSLILEYSICCDRQCLICF